MAKSAVVRAEDDASVNPQHYRDHKSGLQCIQVTEHMPANVAASIKYMWRCGLKEDAPTISDMRKSVWYVNRQLMLMGGESMLRPGLEGPEVLGLKDQQKRRVFTAPEPLLIGSTVKILEISPDDRRPMHAVGDLLTVVSQEDPLKQDQVSDLGKAAYFAAGGATGTYITKVELVE